MMTHTWWDDIYYIIIFILYPSTDYVLYEIILFFSLCLKMGFLGGGDTSFNMSGGGYFIKYVQNFSKIKY